MDPLKFFQAAIAAGILASVTDWYFFGVLFRDRYQATPGVWRKYRNQKDQLQAVLLGTLFTTFTCFLFVACCHTLKLTELTQSVSTAFFLWLMIPVPMLLTQAVFMKYDRALVAAHSGGWLAKLLVSAVCVGLIH